MEPVWVRITVIAFMGPVEHLQEVHWVVVLEFLPKGASSTTREGRKSFSNIGSMVAPLREDTARTRSFGSRPDIKYQAVQNDPWGEQAKEREPEAGGHDSQASSQNPARCFPQGLKTKSPRNEGNKSSPTCTARDAQAVPA